LKKPNIYLLALSILLVISIGFNVYQFIQNRNVPLSEENELTPTPPANSGISVPGIPSKLQSATAALRGLTYDLQSLLAQYIAGNDELYYISAHAPNRDMQPRSLYEEALNAWQLKVDELNNQLDWLRYDIVVKIQQIEQKQAELENILNQLLPGAPDRADAELAIEQVNQLREEMSTNTVMQGIFDTPLVTPSKPRPTHPILTETPNPGL
jgi:hypothetical protein